MSGYDDDLPGILVLVDTDDGPRAAEEPRQVRHRQIEHVTHLDAIITLHYQLYQTKMLYLMDSSESSETDKR